MSRTICAGGQLASGRFPRTLEDAEFLGMGRQVGDDIGGFTPVVCLSKEIKAAIDHFQGDLGHGPLQGFGHGIGQVDQHGIEQPGGPQLHFHSVLRAAPEIGQPQPAIDDRISVFDIPSLMPL